VTTTLTEDLVLLLLDPRTGRSLVDGMSLDRGIGGALLLDLAARERITADGDGARAPLRVSDPGPTGDPLLDEAIGRLAGSPVRAQKAVERLARRTRVPLLERLVDRGLVKREKSRMLGVFPATTWPPADPAPRAELHRRVEAVLRDGEEPDQHLALLISLLHALQAEHKVVDGRRRELRARAKEVAAGDWAGPAVRKAVQAAQASVMVAVAAATSAGAAAGGS
jgi:hypothetical protein